MEPDDVREKLLEATALSRQFALLAEESRDMRVGFLAAIMFAAGSGRAMGMSLHDTMSTMMAVYKDADKFMSKREEEK